MSERDPIDWDELDAETQHELVSLAEKLGEDAKQDTKRTASRREFLGAITAAGLGGSLLSEGADRGFDDFVNPASAGTQSVAQFGEAGEPFDFVAEDIYGPGGQGSGDPVNFESISTGVLDAGTFDRAASNTNPSIGFESNTDHDGGIIGATSTTTSGNDGQYAKYGATYPDGDTLGWFAFDAADEELSLYLSDSASAGSGGDLTKRLDVETSNNSANWLNTNILTVRSADGNQAICRLYGRGSSEQDQLFQGYNNNDNEVFRFGRDVSQNGIIIYDSLNGNYVARYRQNVQWWDWFNETQARFGRVLSNAAAGALETGEFAFDDNRGGTGNFALLRESGGSVHYWDADGTL